MPDPLTRADILRLLDVLQGISQGLVALNQTMRRIASTLKGRSGAPALGLEVWPGKPEEPGVGPGRVRRR